MEEHGSEEQIIHNGDAALYPLALWSFYAIAILTYITLSRLNAPYGRHVRRGWGFGVAAREAWIIFESPALFVMVLVYHFGQFHTQTVPHVLLR